MSTSGFGPGRSEGLPMSSPVLTTVSSLQTTPPMGDSQTMAIALEHMIVMMGRVESGLKEVVQAVKPQGPPTRPDAAPPYGRSGYSHGMTQSQFDIPLVSWTPATMISQPLGFAAHHHTSGLTGPSFSHQNVLTPTALPKLPEIFVPPLSQTMTTQYSGSVPPFNQQSSVTNSVWSPPVSQPPWEPPSLQAPAPLQPRQISCWNNLAYRAIGGQQSLPLPQQQGPSCWSNPAHRQNSGPSHVDSARLIKMKPPRFNGSDAPNWISRVQYYFDHLMLPDDYRLHYVVMLFDPPAAEWIFNYQANNNSVLWHDFLEDVRRRFDPICFQNFIGLIAKLTQTGTLAEYNTKFETMLNRVRGLPESTLTPIYVEGLQQPVKNQVRHQHPSSVASAMALAVEFDGCIERPATSPGFQRRPWMPRDLRPAAAPSAVTPVDSNSTVKPNQLKASPYARLPVIRLSAAEKADRSRKNLCWYCPEKYTPSHVCNKTFLAYMGAEDEVDEGEEVHHETTDDPDVITADISHIYALDGKHRSDAIELQGSICASPVLILVDTGSTHDFLHPRVAEKLALHITPIRPFRVYVGNGESLTCSHVSLHTRLVIQNNVFLVDLHILPIHGPDVILGMAWLKSLRRVTSDYVDGTIEFMREGRKICLRVTPPPPRQVSVKSFATLMSLHGEADLFEVVVVTPQSSPRPEADPQSFPAGLPDSIREVLEGHSQVFTLPSGMPPQRFCDHRIHLLPNSKPVNVRPYRYPYFQKNEIER